MTEIILFIITWVIAGFSGFCLGSAIDYSLLDYYLDKRKKNKIPKNLNQCFKFLDKILNREDYLTAKKNPKFGTIVHHTLGRTLRNEWGLWKGSKLKNYFNNLGIYHADDMSGIILTSYHRYLNAKNIKLDEQVRFYLDYWAKENTKDEEQIDG